MKQKGKFSNSLIKHYAGGVEIKTSRESGKWSLGV
jgi:hypothetical protein